ncbi:hypothetical protein ACQB60_06690 [Actinomycetota bacterium Odt1-20B]
MASWRIKRSRTVIAAGMGLTALFSAALPAAAYDVDDNVLYTKDDQWGQVIKTDDCVQANAWVARVSGIGGLINTALFESHYPASARAPKQHAGGDSVLDLAPGGIGVGKVSALYSRSLGHARPPTRAGGKDVEARGEVYSDAGLGAIDVGIPYIASPFGGTQLSPIGAHVDAIQVSAWSRPGKPVSFTGGLASGYFSVLGFDILDIPDLWASNFGARIPSDYTSDPLLLAFTNEQVTTDETGHVTVGKDKHYRYDGKATSGFVNAIHASVLGGNVADVSLGHAAVIRDPKRTDKYAVKDKLNPVNPGDGQAERSVSVPTVKTDLSKFPSKGGKRGWAPLRKPGDASRPERVIDRRADTIWKEANPSADPVRRTSCAPFAPPKEAKGQISRKLRGAGMNCW